MVDSDIVRKVALQEQDNLFTQAGLEAVAKASGADVVIVMAVDKFDVTEDNFRREPMTILDYRGRFATVNMLNHKFKLDTGAMAVKWNRAPSIPGPTGRTTNSACSAGEN